MPAPSGGALGERFSAGAQAHTVGLTEERAAQIVSQSGNARNVAFLAALLVVLFIPVYWFYDIGLPVIGVDGRLAKEAEQPVGHGRLARLRAVPRQLRALPRPPNGGRAAVGPPLNDQGKLYNAVTAERPARPGPPQPDLPAATC